MRRSSWVLAVAAVAAPVAAGAAPVHDAPWSSIDAHDALAHVMVLAAPEMEGRGAMTPGLARAGDYIAGRFGGLGLLAAGDRGTFFQAVDIPLPRRPGQRSRLVLGGRALAIGDQFSPNAGSAAAQAVGGVVFAGYGISIPGGYDDYADVDARGKLVICLRYAPRYDIKAGKAAEAAFDPGAALRAKAENASRHGAIGIAIVDPPAAPANDSTAMPAAPPRDAAPLPAYGGGARGAGAVASFHLAPAAADQLFATVGAPPLAALRRRIDDSGRPASQELPGFAAFTVEWDSPLVPARNVVALLPGSDPVLRDQAVVIGAHYDHLGRGDEGSAFGASGQVHPGADDNASGTAAVLEIAQALAAAPKRPRRSILFVAFTGEEKGLIGSLALAAQASGRHVVAMLNLDMVGRMRDHALEIGGTPTARDWEAIVNAANQEQLTLTFPKRVVPNSDHASFLGRQVPSLFLFTGLHGDYHRASDTPDKINAEGIAQAARLALRIAVAVADRDERLAFIEPQWTRMGAVGGTHGTTVRLGVMPDYQSTNGLRVSAVLEGGAGAEAGLKAGDVIEGIGEKTVTDIESYMEAIAVFKGGDATVVRIRRGGAPRGLKVKFGAVDPEAGPGSGPMPGALHP
jgi:aminopeptidase YwaD